MVGRSLMAQYRGLSLESGIARMCTHTQTIISVLDVINGLWTKYIERTMVFYGSDWIINLLKYDI